MYLLSFLVPKLRVYVSFSASYLPRVYYYYLSSIFCLNRSKFRQILEKEEFFTLFFRFHEWKDTNYETSINYPLEKEVAFVVSIQNYFKIHENLT